MDVLCDEDFMDYYTNAMLSDGETYNSGVRKIGVKPVKTSDKLLLVYDAIFNTRYSQNLECMKVGSLTFKGIMKGFIMNALGLLHCHVDPYIINCM